LDARTGVVDLAVVRDQERLVDVGTDALARRSTFGDKIEPGSDDIALYGELYSGTDVNRITRYCGPRFRLRHR
jgi:hypothetical protein